MYNQKTFETSEYPMGSHTIVVTYLGDSSKTPLTLEYLVVQNGTFPSGNSSSPTTGGNDANGSAGSSHSSNVGNIAGAVVGGIVFIILATLVIIYFCRWGPKRDRQLLYNHGHDSDNAVEPFQLTPSIFPAPTIYSQYSAVPNTADNQTQHWNVPNQTIKSLNSTLPRTSVSGGTPSPTGHNGITPSSHSRAADIGVLPNPANEVDAGSSYPRREHEASVAVSRPQLAAQPVLSPEQNASSGVEPSRLVMHEDSGIRLPLSTSNGVVEVPPMYTTV
uniref:Uncharacterized protein n=1 Tax=Psilocybe cubensis TaxID=181762 RepID=A0A8H7Y5Z0_PSICU